MLAASARLVRRRVGRLRRLAAALDADALSRDARCALVLVHPLVDGVEGASLCGEEEVGAGVVGELEVERVAGDALPLEANCGDATLALAPSGVGVLDGVDVGHDVVFEPSVHYKVAPAALLYQTDDGVRVGHARRVAEADARPPVARLRLDDKLNRVARLEELPLRKVGTVAKVERERPDARAPVDRPLQVGEYLLRCGRLELAVGRVRPPAGAPLLLARRLTCSRPSARLDANLAGCRLPRCAVRRGSYRDTGARRGAARCGRRRSRGGAGCGRGCC